MTEDLRRPWDQAISDGGEETLSFQDRVARIDHLTSERYRLWYERKAVIEEEKRLIDETVRLHGPDFRRLAEGQGGNLTPQAESIGPEG